MACRPGKSIIPREKKEKILGYAYASDQKGFFFFNVSCHSHEIIHNCEKTFCESCSDVTGELKIFRNIKDFLTKGVF